MRKRKPKKRTITIVCSCSYWLDLTNNINIGNAEELIKYVNAWNIVVANEDCFTRSNEFWYNK